MPECCEFTGAMGLGDTAAVIRIEAGTGGDVSGIVIGAEGCDCSYDDQYCLAPHHRLLTADLRWVPAEEIRAGDRLFAFEEWRQPQNRNRRLLFTTVTASASAEKECAEVLLDNGDRIICSLDHPWLASDGVVKHGVPGPRTRRWVDTGKLNTRHWVSQIFPPWEYEDSREGGWLAGMFDGEGSFTATAVSLRLSLAQKKGPVLDEVQELLLRFKFTSSVSISAQNDVAQVGILKQAEAVRLLGQIRPLRLLSRFQLADVSQWSIKTPNRHRVLSVSPIGKQRVQSIATDSRTYIAEGYLMHNSDAYCDPTEGGSLPNARISDTVYTISELPEGSTLVIDAAERTVTLTDSSGDHLSTLDAIEWFGLFEWIEAAAGGCQRICVDTSGATINGDTSITFTTFDREL